MVFSKVLLAGGAGFISPHIAEKLIKYNHKVIIVNNLSIDEFKNISKLSGIKFYKKDILKDYLSQIFENEKPDYVINLAAQTSATKPVAFSDIDAQLNIVATIKLLQLCKKYNVKKILTASTATVYGNSKYLSVHENHPVEPFSPYGLSKYAMEKYIQLSNEPYIIFRFSNIYRSRQKSYHKSGVIPMKELKAS